MKLGYLQTQKESFGRFDSIDLKIFVSSDPLNRGAPEYVTDCKSLIQTGVVTAGAHRHSSRREETDTIEGGSEQNPNHPLADEERR